MRGKLAGRGAYARSLPHMKAELNGNLATQNYGHLNNAAQCTTLQEESKRLPEPVRTMGTCALEYFALLISDRMLLST